MARPDVRRPPSPIRHRPAPISRLRTRPRRRVLPTPPKTRARHRNHHPTTPPAKKDLTTQPPTVIITTPTPKTPPRWSHHTGETVVPSTWRTTKAPGPFS